jgi:hypothetical protein
LCRTESESEQGSQCRAASLSGPSTGTRNSILMNSHVFFKPEETDAFSLVLTKNWKKGAGVKLLKKPQQFFLRRHRFINSQWFLHLHI